MADQVVGVVRIYRSEPGTWYGGRLGVKAEFRRFGAIGTALITAAVSTAHALDCQRFLATVQPANVRYFERHHFRVLREVQVQGRPHQLMQADLGAYPARHAGTRFTQARARVA
jgi:putative N-acetyltransferase (TIGR04045 family)